MNHQFNVGDLALTRVFDTEIPAGSQVELVERIEKGDMLRGKEWKIKAPTAGWYVVHPGSGARTAYGERELIPLRGDLASVEQKSQAVPA